MWEGAMLVLGSLCLMSVPERLGILAQSAFWKIARTTSYYSLLGSVWHSIWKRDKVCWIKFDLRLNANQGMTETEGGRGELISNGGVAGGVVLIIIAAFSKPKPGGVLNSLAENSWKEFIEGDVLKHGDNDTPGFLEEPFVVPGRVETVKLIGDGVVVSHLQSQTEIYQIKKHRRVPNFFQNKRKSGKLQRKTFNPLSIPCQFLSIPCQFLSIPVDSCQFLSIPCQFPVNFLSISVISCQFLSFKIDFFVIEKYSKKFRDKNVNDSGKKCEKNWNLKSNCFLKSFSVIIDQYNDKMMKWNELMYGFTTDGENNTPKWSEKLSGRDSRFLSCLPPRSRRFPALDSYTPKTPHRSYRSSVAGDLSIRLDVSWHSYVL